MGLAFLCVNHTVIYLPDCGLNGNTWTVFLPSPQIEWITIDIAFVWYWIWQDIKRWFKYEDGWVSISCKYHQLIRGTQELEILVLTCLDTSHSHMLKQKCILFVTLSLTPIYPIFALFCYYSLLNDMQAKVFVILERIGYVWAILSFMIGQFNWDFLVTTAFHKTEVSAVL